MSFTYKNSSFTLFFLFVQLCYTYGACPSLNSTETLTVKCKLHNTTLENCENPMEGTEAHLTCKMFYEEVTLQSNPKRLCQAGRWNGPIPQCYLICGKKRDKESDNNVNELLDYPWHVGIYQEDKELLSGGTLITMNIVLAAAGGAVRIPRIDNRNITNSETIFVASGKYYRGFDDSRDKYAQYSTVQVVHFPEDYKGYETRYESDIAVLVLTDPFQPSQVVQPVCLNFDSPSFDFLLQESGILTAWDSKFYINSFLQIPDVLKVVRVLYVPNNKCYSNINLKYEEYVTIDKICGANLDNASTACAALSNQGGGMFLKNKINDRYYIISILTGSPLASLGPYTCDPNQYSLYTAVYHHQSFVETYATANIEMRNCVLPNHPQGGKYSVFLNKTQTLEYEFGEPVPSHSKLALFCEDDNDVTQYFCSKNGRWNPILRGCTQNDTVLITLPLDKSASLNDTYIILIVLALVIIGLALIAVILYQLKFKKKWQKQREMKFAGLDSFHKSNLKRFNPELDIGDQAEILPYNINFF